jgi:uncharacterized protein YciI
MKNDELPPEVLEIGKNFYRKTLYVLMTRPASPDVDLKPLMVAHLKHQIALEKSGVLFAAGPLTKETGGWPGTGMFILRAGSFEEARAIADSDPMHAAGVRVYDLFHWRMHEGRITLSIDMSDSSVKLD